MAIACKGGFRPCLCRGQGVGRDIYENNDAMNMVGHHHESIQFYA